MTVLTEQITSTTSEYPVNSDDKAHASALFVADVISVLGTWNIVVLRRYNGRGLEIARREQISGPGVYVLHVTHDLTGSMIPEANAVRFFTSGSGGSLRARVLAEYEPAPRA